MDESPKRPEPESPLVPETGDRPEGEGAGDAPAGPDLSRAASVVESLLLVSAKPLSFERVAQLAGGLSRAEVRSVVEILQAKYPAGSSGILVEEVAKGLQLRTNPANQEFVRKLFETRPPRFTRASLETLAVVAYRQPVTRLEIEEIRGVDCAAPLKTLMDRRLVKVVGKKDVAGRPFLFGTSREFLEVFGLSSLSDLPSMSEIEEFLAARTARVVPQEAASPAPLEGVEASLAEGVELAAELLEAEHGEPLLSTAPEIPEGVSDEVLAAAASMEAGDTPELSPIQPSGGKGAGRFRPGEESEEDAEPLIVPVPDYTDWRDEGEGGD